MNFATLPHHLKLQTVSFCQYLAKCLAYGHIVEDLYVKPEYRKAGLGKELFDQVVAEAVKQNVGRMEWTVLEWNEPALNFYKKYNATLDPEWHLGTLTREQLNALK